MTTSAGPSRQPATEAQRKALASAVRLRILRLCLHEERTNRQLADALDRDPATVLHHVRTLVDTGLLAAGDPRKGPRGSREIPYRATGLSWNLDFSAELAGTADRLGPSSAVAAMLAASTEEIARAPREEVYLTRVGLKLSEEASADLSRRLAEVVEEFVARPSDPDGRAWSLLLALHPEA